LTHQDQAGGRRIIGTDLADAGLGILAKCRSLRRIEIFKPKFSCSERTQIQSQYPIERFLDFELPRGNLRMPPLAVPNNLNFFVAVGRVQLVGILLVESLPRPRMTVFALSFALAGAALRESGAHFQDGMSRIGSRFLDCAI